jgi:hypothetical protein
MQMYHHHYSREKGRAVLTQYIYLPFHHPTHLYAWMQSTGQVQQYLTLSHHLQRSLLPLLHHPLCRCHGLCSESHLPPTSAPITPANTHTRLLTRFPTYSIFHATRQQLSRHTLQMLRPRYPRVFNHAMPPCNVAEWRC